MEDREQALVRAVVGAPLYRAFRRPGERGDPTTLSALERRWFVGRQSVAVASKVQDELLNGGGEGSGRGSLDSDAIKKSTALIGTAVFLQLARDGHPCVSAAPLEGERAPWVALTVHVPRVMRGRPSRKDGGPKHTVSRVYYVYHLRHISMATEILD
eukprot:COSAG01_NODE_7907_length_2997_cov_28.082471_2_plen_157_part_00